MATSLTDPEIAAALAPVPKTLTVNGRTFETPFPSPADWRDRWIYFLLVDRFDNPAAPPRFPPYDRKELRYQGGTLRGVRDRLPYLERLGAGALWLSPVLRNPPHFGDFYGGYATLDFLRVEPRFCSDPAAAAADPAVGDAELRELVDAAHARGMHVILDVVLNHAGDLFDYEGMRDEAPWKGHGPEYRVFWRDGTNTPRGDWDDVGRVPGLPRDAGVWPKELQRNDYWRRRGGGPGAPEGRGDFGRLKELVTEYRDERGRYPVRSHLIRTYQYLVGKFDLDGLRIDTLMYVEPEFARIFGNAIREHAQSIGKRNFFMFGEIWKEEDDLKILEFVGRDSEMSGEIVGVDAALDFPVFRRLMDAAKGRRPPADLAAYFEHRKEVQKRTVSTHGEASRFFVTFLENHDLDDRFYWQAPGGAYDDQHTLALGCLFTMQGIPCVYYGAEQGLSGHGGPREAVREALWGKPGAFDESHAFYRTIRRLSDLRAAHPALRYGRQYFRPVSGDGIQFGHSPYPGGVIAFSRILNDREILVVANTSTTAPVAVHVLVDADLNPAGRAPGVLFTNKAASTAPSPVAVGPTGATTRVSLAPMEIQVIG